MISNVLFMLALGITLCQTFQGPYEKVCNSGWTKIQDENTGGVICMRLFPSQKIWIEAQETCEKNFGQLLNLDESYYHAARIQNISTMQIRLRTFLLDSGVDSVWTSLHVSGGKLWWQQIIPQPIPLGTSPLWKWADGQPLLQKGRCAQAYGKIWRRPGSINKEKIELFLHSCNAENPFICVHSGFIVKTSPGQQCPDGWFGTSYSNKCWKYEQNAPADYSGAKQSCEKLGGTLASPNTELQYKLVINTVTNSYQTDVANLTCINCDNRNSEEECLQMGQSESCALNQICMTKVKLQQGKISFSKGCSDPKICRDKLEITKSLCYSGDVILQKSFTELDCYDCCNTTDCNDRLMNGGGPLVTTLNNFNKTMQPSRHKRDINKQVGRIRGLTFWMGLTKNETSYNWESGAEFTINSGHFQPTYEGPPHTGCVRVVENYWQVVDCNDMLPYVCEKEALYGDAIVRKQPEDSGLISHTIDWIHSKPIHKHIKCEMEGYYPNYPVLWVKDGVYINNGMPPAGFTLNITKDLVYKMNPQVQDSVPSLQGYYHCETWIANGTAKIASKPALVIFKDVLTYRGKMQVPNNIQHHDIQKLNLEWGSHLRIHQMASLIEMLTTVQVATYLFTPQVEIQEIIQDSGTDIHFSLYYILSQVGSTFWQDILEELNVTVIWDHNQRYQRFYTKFDRKFLMHLEQTIHKDKITDKTSEWHKVNGHLNISSSDIVLKSTVACPEEYIETENGLLRFMTTQKNSIAYSDEICFSNGQALATRYCSGDFIHGATWDEPETYSDCIQPEHSPVTKYLKDLSQRQIDENNMNKISAEIVNWTENHDVLNFVDIVYSSKILRNLGESHSPSITVGKNMVKCVNNVLSASRNNITKAQLIDKATTRILQSLDIYSRKTEELKSNYTLFIEPKLALQIWESQDLTKVAIGFGVMKENSSLEETSFINYYNSVDRDRTNVNLSNTETAVIFSQNVFGMAKDYFFVQDEMFDIFGVSMSPNKVRITFTIYDDSKLFMSPSQLYSHNFQYVTNSQVISGEVSGIPIKNLSSPVKAIFTPIKNISLTKQWCVYWDFSAAGGLGNWSTDGCWMEGIRDGKIVCLCNHLTNFAVLTQVEYPYKVSDEHTLAMGIISVIGIILSIVGLTLTVFTYVLFRNLRKGMSQKALVNLAVALLCVNIVFLAGIDRTENYYGCVAVAVLLHYFLLVSFGWMLVEGVLQYLKFVKVLNTYIENFVLKTVIPVWGIPAVICAIVAMIDWKLFRGHDKFCWIDLPAFYYAFLLPVGIVIIINTVIFILVIKGITCDRPKGLTSTQTKAELKWLQVKATISCFVVLGLTWVFGFFALRTAQLVFLYLFCFLNAFQGFWIFICYCIKEPAARTHWWNLLHCKQHLGQRKHSNTTSSMFSTSKKERTCVRDSQKSFPWNKKEQVIKSQSEESEKNNSQWNRKNIVSLTSSDSSNSDQPLCNGKDIIEENIVNNCCNKKTCLFVDNREQNKQVEDHDDDIEQKHSKKQIYQNIPVIVNSNVYVNLSHVANLVKEYEERQEQPIHSGKVFINAGYDSTET